MTVQTLNGRTPNSLSTLGCHDDMMPDPWDRSLVSDEEIPEPASATGQYPDDIWAEVNYPAMQGARSLAETDEIPEPASATGQYPDGVWASVNYGTPQALASSNNDAEIPEPSSATGQYPDDVWATATVDTSSPPENASSPKTATQSVPITLESTDTERFLSFKEVDYADDLGLSVDLSQMAVEPDGQVDLSFQEIYRIIRVVAEADSGTELYAALSADREYETPGQSAYQSRHFGLGFGLVLFPQESGLLGKLLRVMQRRDLVAFTSLFAPHSEALLTATNSPTPQDRLQPVGGEVLWREPWLTRFHQAGGLPAFQTAQNEVAIEYQFRPMLRIAYELGFRSDRAMAMVYDRVVTRGLGSGLRWVLQTTSPLQTEEQCNNALRSLGYEEIAPFQMANSWLPQTGQFDIVTHAAVVGALRRRGAVPLSPTEVMGRLVAAAQGTAKQRLMRLQAAPQFEDVIYRLSAMT